MNAIEIIQILNASTAMIAAVGPAIGRFQGAMNSDDEAAVKAALSEFQAQNDQLHSFVQMKLRGKLIDP